MSKLFIFLTAFILMGSYFVSHSPNNNDYQLISTFSIFLLFLPIIISMAKWLGYLKTAITLLSLGLFALLFEAQAIITGWPYGEFIYHQQIGAKVLGIVPWTVPFAWLPLVIGGVVIGYRIHKKPLFRILIASLIMIWADLVIDPGAVGLGFWSYLKGGEYFQVPLSNYFGWLVSSLIAQSFLYLFVKSNLKTLPPTNLVISFYLVILFWTGVSYWLGLWPVTLIGLGLIIFMIKTVYLAKSPSVS